MSSAPTLTRHSRPAGKVALALLIVFSLLGFADAGYLTAKHYFGGPVPCAYTHGCDAVMTSPYATVGGTLAAVFRVVTSDHSTLARIPTAAFGVVFYVAVFFLVILHLDSRKRWPLNSIFCLSIIAVAYASWLLYMMAYRVHAFCQYCLFSDLMTLGIFIVALIIKFRRNKSPQGG